MDDKHYIITIEHEKEQVSSDVEKHLTYHRHERLLGKATRYDIDCKSCITHMLRSLKLPADADIQAIKTKLEDGVLRVVIPRIEEMKSSERVLEVET